MTAVDGKSLLVAVKKAVGSVEPLKTIDVLKNIRIQASDGKLEIMAFNLAKQIDLSVSAEGDLGAVLVGSDLLLPWLSKCADRGPVTIIAGERETVWRCGTASARLPSPPMEAWSGFDKEEPSHSCIVPGQSLADAISASLNAVTDFEDRPWLSGVRLEVGTIDAPGIEGRLAVCGTNGVMIIARDIAATGLTGAGGVIVPIDAAKTIRQLLQGVETASMSWGERRLLVDANSTRFQAALTEGVYPANWRKVVEARDPHVSYDASELRASLNAVASLAPEKGDRRSRAVRFTIDGDKTKLEGAEAFSAIGVEDECRHQNLATPPRPSLVIGADQLIKISDALQSETLDVSISVPGQPVVITSPTMKDRVAGSVPLMDAA